MFKDIILMKKTKIDRRNILTIIIQRKYKTKNIHT